MLGGLPGLPAASIPHLLDTAATARKGTTLLGTALSLGRWVAAGLWEGSSTTTTGSGSGEWKLVVLDQDSNALHRGLTELCSVAVSGS